jgi:hypothetical protein
MVLFGGPRKPPPSLFGGGVLVSPAPGGGLRAGVTLAF